ncbi:MAG: electron transport complex subunit RsxC [Haliea sp.]|uniref:electron transport complex subunit RsxC n=1 Tax=Haliea sp. TaxID=1932666 RepID=UPI000C4FDA3F|nr:electron transport complex subunit RsxC [Haliea sp.]MBM69245.1 electron transport complex subunit RsxC [Haliea sp.]|tara:strand:+ start:1133 stop:2866 length:1734 start_codon:yes stop_codon:yes gene_type:complete
MRRVYGFHGGIHPAENKHQSLGSKIQQAGIPQQLILPLSQHIGAPARPVVAVGDRVLKGQMIAEPVGHVSVPLHAPSSGHISAIEERPIPHPSGFPAPCIVIDCDGEDAWAPLQGVANYRDCEATELLELIRSAGIAGMGGAGFPTAVKLAGKSGQSVKTLIINGTECEPYITADDILMRERADDIVAGIAILQHILQPQETLLGVEDNKPEAIAALQAAAAGSAIEVVTFPTKYPSGGEKQLIEILTGLQVPSGGLPGDLGIVCQNVGTAVAVRDAICHGRPLISRITTVTGNAVDHPQNFEVLLGTPMQYLLDLAGLHPERCERLVMGGPMMGFTVTTAEAPVVKTTNCILAPTPEELPPPPPAQPCIRCGLCAEACPASLLPQQLFWFAQGKEFEKLEQHNLFDCIECGACSWVCPSHIPLVQYYRASKADILQQRREHAKSEQARLRFEARQARLAQEEEEREAKRAARKAAAEKRAALAEQGGEEDPIQAAIERAKAKKAAQQAGDGTAATPVKASPEVALRQKLAKSEQRLAQSIAAGEDAKIVSALEATVQRLKDKLAEAEAAATESGTD